MIPRHSIRSQLPRRGLRALASGLALLVCLVGCGDFFYTSDIAGYVKDNDTDEGVDGARVNIYLSEPDSATSAGYVVATATMVSQGNSGYFSHRIIWQESTPDFGEEGDSGRIWIGVSHEDYFPEVVMLDGVLSDTVNVVPDIQLTRITFTSSKVKGRVVDSSGNGVNTVRVVLNLPSTEDITEDYVVESATDPDDQTIGTFLFEEVEWEDPDAGSGQTSTIDVSFYVDSPDHYSEYNKDSALVVTLTSGQENEVSQSIVVHEAAFSMPSLKGAVLLQGSGVNGVRVVLDLLSSEAGEDYVGETYTAGSDDGVFEFVNVSWRDSSPDPVDADVERVRIYVADENYNADYDQAAPLIVELVQDQAQLLDTSINVTKALFSCPKIAGRVLDQGDNGVDGVSVALDLHSTETVREDHLTTTKTIAGLAGSYQFLDVEWRDTDPSSAISDTETVTISVAESDWQVTSALAVQQIDSDTEKAIATAIQISKKTVWSFTADTEGRCYYFITDADGDTVEIPVRGVKITLSDAGTNGASLLDSNLPIVVETDADGQFAVAIQWIRDKTYNPQVVYADAPAGEDRIVVDIAYSQNDVAGNKYKFENHSGFEVSSSVTNTIPDAVDTDRETNS